MGNCQCWEIDDLQFGCNLEHVPQVPIQAEGELGSCQLGGAGGSSEEQQVPG